MLALGYDEISLLFAALAFIAFAQLLWWYTCGMRKDILHRPLIFDDRPFRYGVYAALLALLLSSSFLASRYTPALALAPVGALLLLRQFNQRRLERAIGSTVEKAVASFAKRLQVGETSVEAVRGAMADLGDPDATGLLPLHLAIEELLVMRGLADDPEELDRRARAEQSHRLEALVHSRLRSYAIDLGGLW